VLLLAVKQIFPDFEFLWLVEEAKKNLPLELDFLNEGKNAEKVAQMLKSFDFLKVIVVCLCTHMHIIYLYTSVCASTKVHVAFSRPCALFICYMGRNTERICL
ncbi:UNVERIFIED_CONTAM: hypothetical protein K2H54_037929, partial [Gekko kuhli]